MKVEFDLTGRRILITGAGGRDRSRDREDLCETGLADLQGAERSTS